MTGGGNSVAVLVPVVVEALVPVPSMLGGNNYRNILFRDVRTWGVIKQRR